MDSISDDEKFQVDHILEQRKRKGVLEYLVSWKGDSTDTWEPAKTIAADCADAVKSFLKTQKSQKSRSKTRGSKSRSRSSSRSRIPVSDKDKARRTSRSRSRGRQVKEKITTATTSKEEQGNVRRSLRRSSKSSSAVTVTAEKEEVKVVEESPVEKLSPLTSNADMSNSNNSNSGQEASGPRRTLRSTTMEQRDKLEVQRVHNDQRPVREDDSKPRSPIWRVADYIVIVLFIISLLAALFLFLEKFVNLENFKKQAFPNFDVLKGRLDGARLRVIELGHTVGGWLSDTWMYVVERIKMPEAAPKQTAAPK